MARNRKMRVIGGVDTHANSHHAAVILMNGRRLGDREFAAIEQGYGELLAWLRSFGRLAMVAVEGTGSYGAALYRHLHRENVRVIDVDRPDRKTRRHQGKSDLIDAYAAAEAALSGRATTVPKARDGLVEAIRALHVARASAVKARTATINQLKALLVTAPPELREQMRQQSRDALLEACLRLRPGADLIAAGARGAPCTGGHRSGVGCIRSLVPLHRSSLCVRGEVRAAAQGLLSVRGSLSVQAPCGVLLRRVSVVRHSDRLGVA
ncbi:transposase [Microbispora sp. KK1-11]|uniref:IS110 family transposase n=1 Tax=Microbispora sp. KK1-11 TaxID=2053005 RepID=UPI00115BF607|nr:transposase [Microbispora sp. KK1-11]TQS24515.1 IS110 family transposase [Microbispora sp. KK1-11]